MDRRSALVGAAMRLHNYCIDRGIGIELREIAGVSEIQPRVWAPTPKFGKNGEPVEFLETIHCRGAPDTSRCERRDKLKEDIERAGLKRPGESARRAALRARTA